MTLSAAWLCLREHEGTLHINEAGLARNAHAGFQPIWPVALMGIACWAYAKLIFTQAVLLELIGSIRQRA
ncbi:MAG: hypothetical protein Q7T62_11650 [Undibacterium sp.]|nr:hypothetical protein [Undibacterium sp.]